MTANASKRANRDDPQTVTFSALKNPNSVFWQKKVILNILKLI